MMQDHPHKTLTLTTPVADRDVETISYLAQVMRASELSDKERQSVAAWFEVRYGVIQSTTGKEE